MGARLTSAPDSLRQQYALAEGRGVLITQVFANSSAEAAGLEAHDIVLRFDGQNVGSPTEIIDLLGQHRAGDLLPVVYLRGAERRAMTLTLRPLPYEQYEDAAVQYDHVDTKTGRLRAIVTRPEEPQGPVPAVFIIQGYDCSSIDQPFSPDDGLVRLVRHFSGLGFATYRVEKSGVGDSLGEPCTEVGFHDETQGFRDAFQHLKRYDFIDPDSVYMLGLSMGGVWAPILASEEQVAGVVVYGTHARPWQEYMVENWRRQWGLAGHDYALIEQRLREGLDLWHYLNTERLTPTEIATRHPHLLPLMREESSDADSARIEHFYGRHFRFLQELSELNIAERWKHVDADVLALWGRGDYVASQGDQQLIVELVNHYRPGTATGAEVEADHWFEEASDFEQSYRRVRANEPGTFQDGVLTVVCRWLTSQRHKNS